MNATNEIVACVMAQECKEGVDKSGDRVELIVCPTARLPNGNVVLTDEMSELESFGFTPVALVRDVERRSDKLGLYARRGLSHAVISALEREGERLIGSAERNWRDQSTKSPSLNCKRPGK